MLLTNNPVEMSAALGLPSDWTSLSEGALAPGDRALFHALAPESGLWARPDLWSEEMEGPGWRHVFLIDRANGSQFDTLRQLLTGPLARECERGPIAALALTGTGFHGQRGRRWAAEGGNLHLCAALAPRVPVSDYALSMTALPSLVAVDTIRAVSGGRLDPGIKWVNDVLLEGRKVAGVLTATQSLGGLLESAVFGIGMNVARTPEVSPTPFVPEVGCLRGFDGGAGVSFPAVVRDVLACFAQRFRQLGSSGPDDLITDYLENAAWMIGRRVRLYPESLTDTVPPESWPSPDASGTLVGIRRDLGLYLEGFPDPIQRGRLAFEDVCLSLGLSG